MQTVVVIDYGSQVTQLIARRVREAGVYSEILPWNIGLDEVKQANPAALILSGSPASVGDSGAPALEPGLLELGVPVLGICYGMQLLTRHYGGELERSQTREYGSASLSLVKESPLWQGLGKVMDKVRVWMSHGDHVKTPPAGFDLIGSTETLPAAAMADHKRNFYGVQFHPEVHHSECGERIIRNFLFNICKLTPDWSMSSFVARTVEELKKKVGDRQVVCALSGGVDSTVTAALLSRAIGKNLHCFFVETGLMREGEADWVVSTLREHFDLNLTRLDAQDVFLGRLAGVADPEEKRKIIGRTFIDLFDEAAHKLDRVDFLAQGTIYPDVIESLSAATGMVIKSHHNVGGLPERMKLDLVEPLRELFKDEVRAVGKELGLPDEFVWRHPFPGPGLAVRILGEITGERLALLRKADVIVLEELRASGWYHKIWQGFAVLLPLKTVGVMGDGRSYEHVIALRAVESVDAMTADWAQLPYELLQRISNRIINEVKGVNRVVYDISSKPPSTIEWE
ncbi:MAG: glutamine-hydrolyzing GMP synthase [Deltaproteobacteria bacterium]|jgi:GMP synthase (glutamine-hydrolysing)|nr:glutamine-hydrolyzing GMP synthase [Deltaproteobacteria bacterium]